jgi:two-component system chemotaxis sensor kinase CheA
MSDDMSQYLGEYIKEAEDLLEQLNSALLSLEKSPEDPEFINQIFRSSHTLKSSSAAMGFKKISELAHSMEDVLGRIKNREISATKEIVDVLFNCFDALETMLGQVSKKYARKIKMSNL